MIISALATTEKALVLVDELGRGTSPQEGMWLLFQEITSAVLIPLYLKVLELLTRSLRRSFVQKSVI